MKKIVLGEFINRHYKTLLPFLTVSKFINIIKSLINYKFRKTKLNSMPFIYRVEPCSICNLKCVKCNTHKVVTNEKRIMDYQDYLTILAKLKKYALRFSLYDMGEPLLHKDIYKIIKAASDENISTLISTNFNLFKKEDLEKLFDSRLTVLEPCLDGFTQENYAKYRQNGDVEIVKSGIKDVMEYKRKNKYKYPILDVQIIEFDHIKDEIPLINQFLKENKVDKITYRIDLLGFNSEETTFKVVSREVPCFWLYLGMMIRPDGNVYPCCGRDFDRFSYGNILDENIEDIWNNKYYTFSRMIFTKGPDLLVPEEYKEIPCISCNSYKKLRKLCFNKTI